MKLLRVRVAILPSAVQRILEIMLNMHRITMIFKALLLTSLLLLHVARNAGVGQPRAAAFWGFEGWYGHDCGHLSYIDGHGVLHEDVLKNAINGDRTPGTTLQYAAYYGGKIYAVSKQRYGAAENRLIRIDPATWTIEQMGGAGFDGVDDEVQTFHFLGVSDRVGYLSSNDELYRINLEDLSAEAVETDWGDYELEGFGTMVLYRGRIVVEAYKLKARELWVLSVATGDVEGKFSTAGLSDPVVTRDGRLLALRLAKKGGKQVVNSLVQLDIDNTMAEPRELLKFEKTMRPPVRMMWIPSAIFASARTNRLFWSVSRGTRGAKSLAMLDLSGPQLQPEIVYTDENSFYGAARENPHDGALWVNCNGDFSPFDQLTRLVPGGAGYSAEARYVSSIQYGFASCPFFEDRHGAELAAAGQVQHGEEGTTIDLCDLVVDRDGFSASVLFGELKVEGVGWAFTLEKNHLLRVKAAGAGCARVKLKAFSNGRSSELTLRFGGSLCTVDSIPLGEGESQLLLGVAVMPNPCGDWVQLRGVRLVARWQAFSQHGRLVAEGVGRGSDCLEISTFAWTAGVYFVRLMAPDGARTVVVVKE